MVVTKPLLTSVIGWLSCLHGKQEVQDSTPVQARIFLLQYKIGKLIYKLHFH